MTTEDNNMGSTGKSNDGVGTTNSVHVSNNAPGTLNLSEKVILKAQLNEDIRRVPINNEEITYDELIIMMQRLFKGQLMPEDDIVLKYKDEDGDMISLCDSSDLTFAIQSCRVLKLRIYLKKDDDLKIKILKNLPIHLVRSELKDLRDRVTRILDLLDNEEDNNQVVDVTGSNTEVSSEKHVDDGDAKGRMFSASAPPAPTPSTREFDPLQHQQALAMEHPPTTNQQIPPQQINKPSGPSPAFNSSMAQNPQQHIQSPPAQNQQTLLRQQPAGNASNEPSNNTQQNYQHQQHQSQMYQPQPMSYPQQPSPHATQPQQQQQQPNVHPPSNMPQSQQQGQISYPNSSSAPTMTGYNYPPYPPPSGQFSHTPTSVPYSAQQPRPSVPPTSVTGPPTGSAITGQPQSQQNQYAAQGGSFPPTVNVPPPPQQFTGQYGTAPGGFPMGPPPPTIPGMTGGVNPFSRPPQPSHYKTQ